MLVLLILTATLSSSWGQRAPTWDSCQCRWNTWEAWSGCSKLCYGTHRRMRSVQVLDTPTCGTFESCDYGEGGRDYQSCNTACTYGDYDSGYGGCKCPEGRYGVCCTNVITCVSPSNTVNGVFSVSDSYNYGSVATYTCDPGYNMTGTATMTCTTSSNYIGYTGHWSGSTPRCLFAESCNSNPCQHGGTCVNGLEEYTCNCPPGWSGVNCETDVHPPVMSDCEDNTTLNTADHELTHEWTVPTFSDPLGNDVTMTSNYHSNSSRFPWGDFFIQYVATKPSNGLQTECKFQLQVRPFPCQEFSVPTNGYVACNDWRSDYGQFCLIGCRVNYSLPRDIDERQWFVCGSSGSWTPSLTSVDCEEAIHGSLSASGGLLGSPAYCSDEVTLDKMRENYITELKSSSFNSFCTKSPELCTGDSVYVECA